MPRKCAHHDVIATPDGKPFVEAVCKLCGRRKSYRASLTPDQERLMHFKLGPAQDKGDYFPTGWLK